MQRYLDSDTFYEFLNSAIIQIKNDYTHFGLESGFISFLDESKLSEKFSIIASIGRFKKENNFNIISAKEIDMLSIVYITKQRLCKNNIFINIIHKDGIDIFFYFEFKEDLSDVENKELIEYFINLDSMILSKEWKTK
jgi:hypothetical protein